MERTYRRCDWCSRRSRHYEHIKADDLVTEKHIRSEVETEKLINWIGGLEPLLVDPSYFIDFIGSRKFKGDPYEHVQKYFSGTESGKVEETPIGPHAVFRGEIAIFSRSIRNSDGTLIFPYDEEKKSGVTESYVVRMKTHDPQRYHAQLANDPKASGLNVFSKEWIRFYETNLSGEIVCRHPKTNKILFKAHPMELSRIILFDPSVAEREGNSKNAIQVLAKGSHPFRILLEHHAGHFPPDEAVELLFELNEKWNPDLVSIEKRGFQGSIKYWMSEKAHLEGRLYPPVVEYPPEGSSRALWAKKERIKGLQPGFRAGLFWIDEGFEDLIEDIEYYPNIRWDDSLDCLAQSLDFFEGLVDDAMLQSESESEKIRLYGAVGRELPVREEEEWNEEAFLASLGPTGYGSAVQRLN